MSLLENLTFAMRMAAAGLRTITPRQYSDDYYGRHNVVPIGKYPSFRFYSIRDYELAYEFLPDGSITRLLVVP